MKYYLAPLEGITGHIYRNLVEKYFPGTDRYFTPFIAPDQNKILRTKEHRDVLPENNHVPRLIPQILTNNPDHFYRTVMALKEFGYDEVNLNLGCPSGTVVSRKRGSGMLEYLDELDSFLGQIFYDNPDIKISIKTRIGRDDDEDAEELMEIYRKYPLSELIIHPRTQKDFYRGEPRWERFEELLRGFSDCAMPVSYNGNILTARDYEKWILRLETNGFSEDCLDSVMLGRGMLGNPGLIRQIKTGKQIEREELRRFHDELLEGYRSLFGEDRNALFRMKELWIYMIHLFAGHEKLVKKLRKSQSLLEYTSIVKQIFAELDLQPEGPAYWNLPQR